MRNVYLSAIGAIAVSGLALDFESIEAIARFLLFLKGGPPISLLEAVEGTFWKIILLTVAIITCSSVYLLFCTISDVFGTICAIITAVFIIYYRHQ